MAASEKVATESQQLGQALYAQQQADGTAGGATGAAGDAGPADGADDVVDAEIVDDDQQSAILGASVAEYEVSATPPPGER